MKIILLFFSLFLFSSCDFFDVRFFEPGWRSGPKPGTSTPKELINEPLKEMYFFIYYSLQYTEEKRKKALEEHKYCFDDSEASRLQSICKRLRSVFVKDHIQFSLLFFPICESFNKDDYRISVKEVYIEGGVKKEELLIDLAPLKLEEDKGLEI